MDQNLGDIELVQKYFKVDTEKAQVMIDKGLNLEFLRNGFIKTEQERIKDKYQDIVDTLVEEELESDT